MNQKIKNYLLAMNPREQMLAVGAVIVLLVIMLIEVVTPLWAKVETTKAELKQVREQFEALPNQIERFQKLYVKQDAIEKEFKELSFKDGVLSHIENLIRKDAKIESISNYKINPLPSKKFSNEYEQEPFKIELFVTSIPDLTAFLEELVHGRQPLVLTSLDIKKAPNRTKLIVQLNVSNFKQI